MIIPNVIGCSGGGMRRVTNQIGRLVSHEEKTRPISNEMAKKALFGSELSGLMQESGFQL